MDYYPVPQPVIHIFGINIDFSASLMPYYYLALILAVITCLVYFKLYSSRLGRVWESIGKTEDLLANTGISVFTQKQICFFRLLLLCRTGRRNLRSLYDHRNPITIQSLAGNNDCPGSAGRRHLQSAWRNYRYCVHGCIKPGIYLSSHTNSCNINR